MATRLNKETLDSSKHSRYDWDEWLDGSVWEGRKGADFTCKTQSFVSQLYKAAYDRDLRIHVNVKSDDVVEWEAYPFEDQKSHVA